MGSALHEMPSTMLSILRIRLSTVFGILTIFFVYVGLFSLWFVSDFQRRHGDVKLLTLTVTQTSTRYQRGHRCNVIRVESVGNFSERVAAFNIKLSSVRLEQLQSRGADDWRPPTSKRVDVVNGARDEYMQELCNYSSVKTVVLPWTETSGNSSWSSLRDTSNMLLQTYYEWTADDTLCSWIETHGVIKLKYDAIYNRTCNRKLNDIARPTSLRPVFLNAKPINPSHYWPNNGSSYPAHFYTDTPPVVTYMHIHRDAIVTNLGDVTANGLKLVLYACSNDINPSVPSNCESFPLYDDIYVITQYWGSSVFHLMTEVMPRVALHVDFLKAHPQIRILGSEVGGRAGELLEIVGLNHSRLVTGAVRAKIVYQPRATGCGFANVQESQVLSQLYRDYIRRNFPPRPRNRLILIRRWKWRRFTEQTGIEQVLERVARDYNLTYTMFIDNPTPSLNDTMIMFHSAVMVVAPHGAGLSNLYFSQPGTYVIEGVCNLPHVNFCFQRLAVVLGHHWHGVASRLGCEEVVDIPTYSIDDVARQYLQLWSSHV